MVKTAIITGVSGQDGSYLAELLVKRGVRVLAYLRPESRGLGSACALSGKIATRSFPIDSQLHWDAWLREEQPDEFYHLAASPLVRESWQDPIATNASTFNWTTRILESVRRFTPATRVLVASSSEIFGRPTISPQNERTPTLPVTPFGVTKAATGCMVDAYRKKYGLYLCNAILYSHESPRRPHHFLTRKISRAVAAIHGHRQTKLALGNLDVSYDLGYAIDHVDAMSRMLKLDSPEDFVIGTGVLQRLQDIVEIAFDSVELDFRKYVEIDPSLSGEFEPQGMVADPSKARELLGWQATTTMPEWITIMVQSDIDELRRFMCAA